MSTHAKWRVVSNEEAASHWDQWLLEFDDYSIHQCYAWGKLKERLGWNIYRLVYEVESGRQTLIQILQRQYPFGVHLIWIPGGPVGGLENCNHEFRDLLRTTLGARHVYFRM